ncbi:MULTISPECIES: plasmid replication protein RepC [unclassified Rhizobium]|uniref:plasmid replication protein RepC n=1 Tax=unclassified Rhizobium TaxID=2613769 RepID=UPI000BCBBD93|nr:MULTISPECIES: plasmid replication protein RepC [unclassified Rhizobium]MDH7809439.1 replication initiation protein RepC [Rhizobium sp. AN67]MDQ4408703.1 plasmid replication protein RepC [Rhizobium sp. AN63]SOD50302.1 replication initiation protein RepC [Rhizobium sp. AN6A]
MHTESVTTPFGRRPVTLALVRRQQAACEIPTSKSADKWKVFRDACAAMELLGLQSNSLSVLDALLSFFPEKDLRGDAQLVVFPSNIQLSLRAHSMPGSTLRRHLGALVDAGLIIRKDSANGKRFARKGADGDVESAFGFDLSPMLARAEELALLAQQVIATRAEFRKAKEKLTICRRDTRKLISAAIEEGVDGDWQSIENIYVGLVSAIPRTPSLADVAEALESMEMLKEEILNRLETNTKAQNNSTNDAQNGRHIQNSNPESTIVFEPSSRREQGENLSKTGRPREPLKAFPLSVVLKACPQIPDYGPGGAIGNWRDLMSAAVVIRSMLGVSPSAYQEACEVMGPENAAVAMACIFERANLINSAGGYLRDLTRRAEQLEFSLGPMIMALLKANAGGQLKTG